METINMCVQNNLEQLEIIHGHRHGQVLQTCFCSEVFLNEISALRLRVEISDISNSDSTLKKVNDF